jgi:PAS domain-containing protein
MAGNPGSFEQGAAGNGDEKENRMKGRPAQRRKLPFQRRVRRANRKLKEEALHLAVIEQSPDGIYLVDADTRCIVEANIAFAEMLGYTSDEVQGLSIYDFVAQGGGMSIRGMRIFCEQKGPLLSSGSGGRKMAPSWMSGSVRVLSPMEEER